MLALIQVTTAADVQDSTATTFDELYRSPGADGHVSLREAVHAANQMDGEDTITFSSQLSTTPIVVDSGPFRVSDSVRIVGNGVGKTIVNARQQSQILVGDPLSNILVAQISLTGGRDETRTGGGAISTWGNLTIEDANVSDNSTIQWSGAIWASGDVTIVRSTIANNRAQHLGGGAIRAEGNISVLESTIHDNVSEGDRQNNRGGGLYSKKNISIVQSTLSGNWADAGGASVWAEGDISISSSTVFANGRLRPTRSSGIHADGSISIFSSIVDHQGVVADFNKSPTVVQNSLVATNENTNLTATFNHELDPNGNIVGRHGQLAQSMLGPINNYGGPTPTHRLLPQSPAINNGSLANEARNDQRGEGYAYVDDQPDMGAVETASLIVTTEQDVVDGWTNTIAGLVGRPGADGSISLREALLAINNDPGFHRIEFDPAFRETGFHLQLRLGQLVIGRSVTIAGLGADTTTIDGLSQQRVFYIATPARNVQLHGMKITGGRLAGGFANGVGGAGVSFDSDGSLRLSGMEISNNESTAAGAGIFVRTGELHLIDSSVLNNSVVSGAVGGGIASEGTVLIDRSTIAGNQAATGGGVFGANVTIQQSTIHNNVARDFGGGVISSATLTLFQSTVSGNSAGQDGGGVFSVGSQVSITHATIVENTGGGIFWRDPNVDVSLVNSIVAKNWFPRFNLVWDVSGVPSELSGNVVSIWTSGNVPPDVHDANHFGSQANPVDPLIAPLADNGGPTLTHALMVGNSAQERGQPNEQSDYDQRGRYFARTQFSRPDAGAFESHRTISRDINQDRRSNSSDVDSFCESVRAGLATYDLNLDGQVTASDLWHFVENVTNRTIGDANYNSRFDSADLVKVFQAGEYEDGVPENSTWAEGDWNCDAEFNTADLVAAFQADSFIRAVMPSRLDHQQLAARLAGDELDTSEKNKSVRVRSIELADAGRETKPKPTAVL